MRLGIVVILGSMLLNATTLEQLSVDQMIQQSTSIVCGKVLGSTTVMRGNLVFTQYQVRITDRWKGSTGAEMSVFAPGGRFGSITQVFPGAPTLGEGSEYVLFLWTSRTGLTQVIGLNQGLFDVRRDSKGEPLLYRRAISQSMVDSSGKVVEDTPVSMRLRDMVNRIQRTLTGVSQ